MRGGPGGRYSQVAMVSSLKLENSSINILNFVFFAGRISQHAGSKGQKRFTSGERIKIVSW